jgi:hypothetical protein
MRQCATRILNRADYRIATNASTSIGRPESCDMNDPAAVVELETPRRSN